MVEEQKNSQFEYDSHQFLASRADVALLNHRLRSIAYLKHLLQFGYDEEKERNYLNKSRSLISGELRRYSYGHSYYRGRRALNLFFKKALHSLHLTAEDIEMQKWSFKIKLQRLKCLSIIGSEDEFIIPTRGYQTMMKIIASCRSLKQFRTKCYSGRLPEKFFLKNKRTWRNIRSLSVPQSFPTEILLEKLPKWPHMEYLDLNSNNITDKEVILLSKSTSWVDLRYLNLSCCYIGDEGTDALAQNRSWEKLQFLDLGKNEIDNEGVIALSKNTVWTELKHLDLSSNKFGDAGVEALSKNTTCWMNLGHLDLRFNRIDENGAKALSESMNWNKLKSLILWGNSISPELKEVLKNKYGKDVVRC